MKGYSKIKLVNSTTTKSRSMDLSNEPIITPTIQNPISIKKPTITITQQQPQPKKPDNNNDDDDDDYKQYSDNHHQEDDNNNNNNNFPARIMMTRNQSVASRNNNESSRRPKIEKQNSTGSAATLQTAVKRVLSIGRSSSVSERYSRIHDQYANYINDHEEEEEEEEELKMGRRSENKMKKKQRSQNRGGVIRACKRIFGF